jgi:hypothetical protein
MTGWVDPQPLTSPPGQDAIARLVNAQDAKDRVELLMRTARQRVVDRALAEPAAKPPEEEALRAARKFET